MTRPGGIERVLYNLHRRVCNFSLRHTSNHTRRWLEHLWLVLAICGFGGLILLHLCFVYRPNVNNVSTQCLRSIPGFIEDADVTHIVLLHQSALTAPATSDNTSNTAGTMCATSRVIVHEPMDASSSIHFQSIKQWQSKERYLVVDESTATTSDGPRQGDDAHDESIGSDGSSDSDTSDSNSSNGDIDGACGITNEAGVIQVAGSIQYSFSDNRAYLQLSHDDNMQQYLKRQYAIISPRDMNCFGEPFLQTILWNVVGTDTVIINWLLAVVNRPPQLHRRLPTNTEGERTTIPAAAGPQAPTLEAATNGEEGKEEVQEVEATKQTTPTWQSHVNKDGPFVYHSRSHKIYNAFIWERDYLNVMQRVLLLIQTAFLFVTTTTMVSFTLRETQERMLEFTQELNRRVQGREPVRKLVSSHLMQNLIFCPIMVGMLFFLIEFYDGDKFLAFLVMTMIWIAEVFSVISLRSIQGITFFPRIFFLLFCLFHVYYFAYPLGFGYTAMGTVSCFILHSMLFFWHRYELPAVALGWVDAQRPRMMTSSSDNSQLVESNRIHVHAHAPTLSNVQEQR